MAILRHKMLLLLYLKKCYVIVVGDTQVVVRMRDNSLDLDFLTEVGMSMSPCDTELNGPPGNLGVAETARFLPSQQTR